MVDPQYTQEELQSEEWRAVVGYEGWYSVSSLGRVRRERPAPGATTGRILLYTLNTQGYLQVALSQRNERRSRPVHRLVAVAFLGPCPTDHEVHHVDESTRNPRASNLRYVTRIDNLHYSLERFPRGEGHYNMKLTDADVAEIRALKDSTGMSNAALGRQFGVAKQTIWKIVHNVYRV